MKRYRVKIASEPDEWRQIRELNYRTFAEEIPQHTPNADRSLVDRFEDESTYLICLCGDTVVGMLAPRSKRPFSLDEKVPDLDSFLPPHRSACEIRLLAISPDHRSGRVLAALSELLFEFFDTHGHDLGLISGTPRQAKLYRHLGFTAFGPIVGTEAAPYQPMYQFREQLRQRGAKPEHPALGHITRRVVNLMPGPVNTPLQVQAALNARPMSHRSILFRQLLERTCAMLCELTQSVKAVIATGSGTLANDLVAGQIAQYGGRGLILVNGEFGNRLVDHATRMGLSFDTVSVPWGETFSEPELRKAVTDGDAISWIWSVHAETSTGVLNDLAMLKQIAAESELMLCLDCISSLGVVPCDLRGVALASGVSGKGLRCMAGLALVFHDGHLTAPTRPLPRSLDLQLYRESGVPFTLSSNLLKALNGCLEHLNPTDRYAQTAHQAAWLRRELAEAGIEPLAAAADTFPGALTLAAPSNIDSVEVGDALQRAGWLLNYRSQYLTQRNWIQLCPMSQITQIELEPLAGLLATHLAIRAT
jgi:aspartate aminotransferase-like enzyme